MANITNDMRRDLAQNMRCAAAAMASGTKVQAGVMVAAACMALMAGEDEEDWAVVLEEMAEMVDRPLCEPLFYEANETGDGFAPSDKQNATFAQCGNCGARLNWASAYDNPLPHFCHNCGAEVER